MTRNFLNILPRSTIEGAEWMEVVIVPQEVFFILPTVEEHLDQDIINVSQ